KMVPDMQQFLQVLPKVFYATDEHDTVTSAWAAYTMFHLLHAKHRPLLDESVADPAGVLLNTQVLATTMAFPFGQYARDPHCEDVLEVHFPLAMNINMKFDPRS